MLTITGEEEKISQNNVVYHRSGESIELILEEMIAFKRLEFAFPKTLNFDCRMELHEER